MVMGSVSFFVCQCCRHALLFLLSVYIPRTRMRDKEQDLRRPLEKQVAEARVCV